MELFGGWYQNDCGSNSSVSVWEKQIQQNLYCIKAFTKRRAREKEPIWERFLLRVCYKKAVKVLKGVWGNFLESFPIKAQRKLTFVSAWRWWDPRACGSNSSVSAREKQIQQNLYCIDAFTERRARKKELIWEWFLLRVCYKQAVKALKGYGETFSKVPP